mgnify:CR=1 FL=1
MAWVTTNRDVATSLTVHKKVGGINISGYPKSYSILSEFPGVTSITLNQWQKLADRSSRIAAFKQFINAAENIDVDATATNDVYRTSTTPPGVIVER